MDESGGGHGSGAAQAAVGSSLLDAHDHTRLWLQSKLSGDWSAQAGASGLTEERLNALLRCFGTLDSMVKVRLLLAGLFVPRQERSRLQPLLGELASQAAGNQDEWVRATAAVVGDYSGLLDMRALMTQFPLVRESIMRFSSQLAELNTPPSLLPQTEQYMHRDISRLPAPALAAGGPSAASGARPHFRLRETAQATAGDAGGGGGGGGGGGAHGAPGGLGGAGGSGSGLGLLSSLGSVGVGAAGSLGLDAKASLGPGPGSSGDSVIRRGLAPTAGVETSMLRSRADVSHSKDAKQGPPTPSGKSVTGPPGLALRLNRSRSLVTPDQLPIPESPHAGGGTPSAAAAGAAAAAPTSTTAGGVAAPLPPLPPLHPGHSSAAAGGAPVARRDSLPHVTRGSWQGGAASTTAAQQYPLAAAIAFAAAAASAGGSLPAGGLSPFHAGSTAAEPPSVQSYQQQQQRDFQPGAHLPYGRRGNSQEPQAVAQDAGGNSTAEQYDDGYGAGDDQLVGRRPSQGFERRSGSQGFERRSGSSFGGQWSGGDSGGGQEGGHGPTTDAGAEYRAGRPADEEPDAKRPRAGV